MLSSKELKLFRKLKQRKFRSGSEYFVAEGKKLCMDIWKFRPDILECLYVADEKDYDEFHDFPDNKKKIIDSKELSEITQTVNSQGVLALCKKFSCRWPEDTGGLSFYLWDIQDPGNVGTILRICAWFGIKHIFCSSNTADFFHPKVIQSSMGGFLFCFMHEAELGEVLKKNKFDKIYRSDMNGVPLRKIKKGNYLILLGNEGNGYSKELIQNIPDAITVEGTSNSKPESLNVAVTCGIVCFALT
jgi:TrmH family RNA methyltransferase